MSHPRKILASQAGLFALDVGGERPDASLDLGTLPLTNKRAANLVFRPENSQGR
ncbi:MAG: hypothetical protein QNJ19_01335 [Woeseiaceae bacterium]|nr:hypothetical protein [Woeseiaceae bacterium]